MTETFAANGRRRWRLSFRDWLVLLSAVSLGLLFWVLEGRKDHGVMAAIASCIIFGLTAQACDLWSGFKAAALTSEERWAWRFAITWRMAVICLIVAYFLVQLLGKWKIVDLSPGDNVASIFYLSGIHEVVLLTAMTVALAGSLPLVKRTERRRWWSWAIELLGCIAACVLCVVLLMDHFIVSVLVHITIAGIEMAQPLRFSSEALAACDTGRLARFSDITTAGVASVLAAGVSLRLLSVWWRRGVMWRAFLGTLLGINLIATVVLSAQVALVEVPNITPALTAEIHWPKWHQWAAAAVLTLLLVSAIARRWSAAPSVAGGAENPSWRRTESRYYHERRIFLWPLLLLLMVYMLIGIRYCFGWSWAMAADCLASWIMSPQLCLYVALVILLAQNILAARSRCAAVRNTNPPPLTPGLFLLVWWVMLILMVCGTPILGAWGFALWFNLG